MHPVPVPLSALPPVDAVVISHDHYDHLDLPTVRTLMRTGTAPFVVPLGVGDHLRRWGVPDGRVVELDWNESTADPGTGRSSAVTPATRRPSPTSDGPSARSA
jgi:L-ascorbate metabolism protein UlaG (beta-lactamase superfamily)